MAGILYSDYYLSEHFVPVREILKTSRLKEESAVKDFIEHSRLDCIAIENKLDEIEIYKKLVERMIANGYQDQLAKISHIIYINGYKIPDAKISLPFLLQKMYSLEQAAVINLDMNCGATVEAFDIADAMVKAGRAQTVMILSNILGYPNRFFEQTVLGDAAALALYGEDNPACTFLDFYSVADGCSSYNLYSNLEYQFNKFNIFRRGCQVIRHLLDKHALQFDQIRVILPLSLNHYNYTLIAEQLGISSSKFYLDNIPRGGHLGDVDTIRNFTDFYRQCSYKDGDYMLIYALGFYNNFDVVYHSALCKLNHRSACGTGNKKV